MKRLIVLILMSMILLQGCSNKTKDTKLVVSNNVQAESTENQKNRDNRNALKTQLNFIYHPQTEEEKLIESLIIAEANYDQKKLQSIYYPTAENETMIGFYNDNSENVRERLDILKMWYLNEHQWKDKMMAKGPSGDIYNANALYYLYPERLENIKYKEIKVLAVDSYKKCTDEFDKIGQFTTGNYTNFYVLIKTDDNSSWKVFDEYMDFTSNLNK